MDRSGAFDVHDKGTLENIVTSSDLAVQHYLTRHLKEHFPEVGFLCEEEDLRDVSRRPFSQGILFTAMPSFILR